MNDKTNGKIIEQTEKVAEKIGRLPDDKKAILLGVIQGMLMSEQTESAGK